MNGFLHKRGQLHFASSLVTSLVLGYVLVVTYVPTQDDQIARYGLPEGTPLRCGHFIVAVDGATRGPRWALEHLTPGEFRHADRDGLTFRAELRIPSEFRTLPRDFKEPLFDVGHMIPAANGRTPAEIKATFNLANAWPQSHAFNAGVWLSLEKEVRRIATTNESWVISAPIWNVPFDYRVESIGKTQVRIPPAFGKSMLTKTSNGIVVLSWIIPHHEETRKPLPEYRVTTDEFETAAGLDVWSLLPQDVQQRLEAVR